VMSAFYVVAYLSISVPAVAAGLAVPGLGLEPTFRIFAGIVAALALAVSIAAARGGYGGPDVRSGAPQEPR
jgi:hypothetical protein